MAHQDDLRRWELRRRDIYHYIIQHGPRATAKAFGISRQRVHQIKERIEKDGKDHAGGSDTAPAAGTAVD